MFAKVKKALDVCLQYVVDPLVHDCVVNDLYHVVTASSRPKPVGAVQEPRLVNTDEHL